MDGLLAPERPQRDAFQRPFIPLASALPANVDLDQCIQTPLGDGGAQYNAQSWEKLP
jgi:hypothetical protein